MITIERSNAPTGPLPRLAAAEVLGLTTKQAAAMLGVSVRTLENYRVLGTGPAYVILGERTVRYLREDLLHYMRSRRVRSTSQRRE